MSEVNDGMMKAFRRGYRVTEDGNVMGPTGLYRRLRVDTRGYYVFSFTDKGHRVHAISVHRLAAYQWFGSRLLQDGNEVRHLNGEKLDNSRANILVGTHLENMRDKPKEDRVRYARNAGRGNSHLTVEDVRRLLEDREMGMTYRELQEKYDLAKSTVSYIVNRKTYADVVPRINTTGSASAGPCGLSIPG